MGEPVAGKFLLEILTKGMYSNPKHVYREYIQNCTDAIDKAIASGLLDRSEAAIRIQIDSKAREIIIRDNGCGISFEKTRETLLSIGHSEKNGIDERGFRGIGRLAGLAYAEEVRFITSAQGENVKTIMRCDCVKMQQLLLKINKETTDVMETFQAITSFEEEQEDVEKHYFEVEMIGVPLDSGLLNCDGGENEVYEYLSETAPIDFDDQKFPLAHKIRKYFEEKGCEQVCYKILQGERGLPIYKAYSLRIDTGKKPKTKDSDIVKDVLFTYQEASDGKPLFIGWIAITDFSGRISNKSVRGIRLRKGNILVGNNTTFDTYFPSEGHAANGLFAGEIYALHEQLVPNSQRDEFESNAIYTEFRQTLGEWAKLINKKYRRGTSEVTSAQKKLQQLDDKQNKIETELRAGAISSDEKRAQMLAEVKEIEKSREATIKKLDKAMKFDPFGEERKETFSQAVENAERSKKKATTLSTEIVNADYATKRDLPTSYSREERRIYHRIIEAIDSFFLKDPETAKKLREVIIQKLSEKKK